MTVLIRHSFLIVLLLLGGHLRTAKSSICTMNENASYSGHTINELIVCHVCLSIRPSDFAHIALILLPFINLTSDRVEILPKAKNHENGSAV